MLAPLNDSVHIPASQIYPVRKSANGDWPIRKNEVTPFDPVVPDVPLDPSTLATADAAVIGDRALHDRALLIGQ